ncbi:radical S-adenosyl methionine domain-containing protein 1 [Apophysomyces sp. BC1015]|nr:radical S-adenosyl methionine domain-containing protein 1 [Apophysomyces sp. BC1015]
MTREIEHYMKNNQYLLKHRKVHSVYFGGGTPSMNIAHLLDTVDKHVGLSSDIEVTLEANPTSIESLRLQDFRQAGVNRLSLGIQSFRDRDLKILGRDHSADDGVKAIMEAKKIFDKVTFDLIFARPGQSLREWREELQQGLELAGDHLSMYQLTMERSTPLHKLSQRGIVAPLPSADEAADMYEETVKVARNHGFNHYEVSNYCRNEAAIGQHNFAYWQGLDYVGIGPGAHGRLTDTQGRRMRTFGEFHPDKYMSLCESEGEGIRKITPIPVEQIIEELIVFGLRTRMGITRSRFKRMTGGLSLDDAIDQDILKLFVESGFLVDDARAIDEEMNCYVPKSLQYECAEGGIRPTEEGLARMDSILPQLLKK